MIDSIKHIRNIGQFASVSSGNSLPFKRLTLIYAENGRGKTTLAAILRSLATGDPTAVIERKRLGAENPPHAVIRLNDGPRNLVFQNGQWNGQLPNLVAFDDAFVDQNVCSGLAVESSHRKQLHELVLGTRGVELSKRLQYLVGRIDEHNRSLRDKANAIPASQRGDLSIEEFCLLPRRLNIDTVIQDTGRMLVAARKRDDVLNAPLFKMLAIPSINVDTIEAVLQRDLPDLDTEAVGHVRSHIEALGLDGERWIGDGIRHLPPLGSDGSCPFCAQNLGASHLIAHYRAYFSQAYADLKRQISQTAFSS